MKENFIEEININLLMENKLLEIRFKFFAGNFLVFLFIFVVWTKNFNFLKKFKVFILSKKHLISKKLKIQDLTKIYENRFNEKFQNNL